MHGTCDIGENILYFEKVFVKFILEDLSMSILFPIKYRSHIK